MYSARAQPTCPTAQASSSAGNRAWLRFGFGFGFGFGSVVRVRVRVRVTVAEGVGGPATREHDFAARALVGVTHR